MNNAGKNDYSVGYGDSALSAMRMRRAERCCRFFRHHVKVGSNILDCGCGPGAVTVGLAQWASKGKTVGVDIGAEPLEVARQTAQKLGVGNVSFQEASIFSLPFPDESFDIVFAQTVFIHIPDHDKALAEMKRVLSPGGLIALREGDHGSTIDWPDDPLVAEVARLFSLNEQHCGGNPDVGRQLGTLLLNAGFENVFLTFDFMQPEQPEKRAGYFHGIAGVVAGEIGTRAIQEGWISEERLDQVVTRFHALADKEDAVHLMPYGQAVGRKPA